MSTVQEIENAIVQLPPDEFNRLRAWMSDYECTAFDRQIASDSTDGKLDFLIDELDQDIRHGRVKPLNEFIISLRPTTSHCHC